MKFRKHYILYDLILWFILGLVVGYVVHAIQYAETV